jgi:hypothetical protein
MGEGYLQIRRRDHPKYDLLKCHSNQPEPDGSSKLVKWKEWNDKIQRNFERCYYVPKGI